MIRRPPRSTLDRSSAASDVYKRQGNTRSAKLRFEDFSVIYDEPIVGKTELLEYRRRPVSYTHLRAHETVLDLVCRLLLEKKKKTYQPYVSDAPTYTTNNEHTRTQLLARLKTLHNIY